MGSGWCEIGSMAIRSSDHIYMSSHRAITRPCQRISDRSDGGAESSGRLHDATAGPVGRCTKGTCVHSMMDS